MFFRQSYVPWSQAVLIHSELYFCPLNMRLKNVLLSERGIIHEANWSWVL
jgi:hypothetical protein